MLLDPGELSRCATRCRGILFLLLSLFPPAIFWSIGTHFLFVVVLKFWQKLCYSTRFYPLLFGKCWFSPILPHISRGIATASSVSGENRIPLSSCTRSSLNNTGTTWTPELSLQLLPRGPSQKTSLLLSLSKAKGLQPASMPCASTGRSPLTLPCATCWHSHATYLVYDPNFWLMWLWWYEQRFLTSHNSNITILSN